MMSIKYRKFRLAQVTFVLILLSVIPVATAHGQAVSPEGDLLVLIDKPAMIASAYDLKTGELTRVLAADTLTLLDVAFSDDGQEIYIVGIRGVIVFDRSNLAIPARVLEVPGMALWLTDGHVLAPVYEHGEYGAITHVKIHSVATGEQLRAEPGEVKSAAHGRYIVELDGRLESRAVGTGEVVPLPRLPDLPEGDGLVTAVNVIGPHHYYVTTQPSGPSGCFDAGAGEWTWTGTSRHELLFPGEPLPCGDAPYTVASVESDELQKLRSDGYSEDLFAAIMDPRNHSLTFFRGTPDRRQTVLELQNAMLVSPIQHDRYAVVETWDSIEVYDLTTGERIGAVEAF